MFSIYLPCYIKTKRQDSLSDRIWIPVEEGKYLVLIWLIILSACLTRMGDCPCDLLGQLIPKYIWMLSPASSSLRDGDTSPVEPDPKLLRLDVSNTLTDVATQRKAGAKFSALRCLRQWALTAFPRELASLVIWDRSAGNEIGLRTRVHG